MSGFLEMLRRMLVLRTIAAADMAADQAHAQIDPGIPGLDAILANLNILRMHFLYFADVGAGVHKIIYRFFS